MASASVTKVDSKAPNDGKKVNAMIKLCIFISCSVSELLVIVETVEHQQLTQKDKRHYEYKPRSAALAVNEMPAEIIC